MSMHQQTGLATLQSNDSETDTNTWRINALASRYVILAKPHIRLILWTILRHNVAEPTHTTAIRESAGKWYNHWGQMDYCTDGTNAAKPRVGRGKLLI